MAMWEGDECVSEIGDVCVGVDVLRLLDRGMRSED